MPSKNRVWTTVAEDYNSPLTRNEIWTRGMARYPEFLGTDAVTIGIVGRDGNINYIADMNSWQHVHEQLKAKALKENTFVEKLIDRALAFGEETNLWSQKYIHDVSLTKASPNKLIRLYHEVYEREETLYALGTGLVILDFHDFSFVEGNLRKFLNALPEAEQKECFRVFTEPVQNSFAQDQEEDLLKLMQQWFEEENWKATVQNESLEHIKKLFPTFYTQLQKHTKKHCWVYYVYAGPAFTEDDFLNFIKEYLKKATIPQEKLRELDEKKKKVHGLKEQYIQELKPDKFQETIIRLAGKVVWAKPRRKDLQSKTYCHLEKLQREIGARLHLSLKEVRHMPLADVEKALTTGEINREKIEQTIQHHVFIPEDKGVKFLYGSEAEEFYKNNVETKHQEIKQISTIKGACACKGNARGIVKIINTPADMKKMNEGDILVSIATTPSIIAAMKKAAAFITDEGGLTCHASIVSRELNTPCVVGTKIATKILKDGDRVEVDAEHGIVRKLK